MKGTLLLICKKHLKTYLILPFKICQMSLELSSLTSAGPQHRVVFKIVSVIPILLAYQTGYSKEAFYNDSICACSVSSVSETFQEYFSLFGIRKKRYIVGGKK